MAATQSPRGYPKRPPNESHIAPRSKFDLCQTQEEFAHLLNATQRKIDEQISAIRRMTGIFELAMFLLIAVFIGVTAARSSSTAIAPFFGLFAFNVIYLLMLFDPAKAESDRAKHEEEWDVVISRMQDRLKFEKRRFLIGLYIGGAFCLLILLALFIVDIA